MLAEFAGGGSEGAPEGDVERQGRVPFVQMHVVLTSSPAVTILDDAQAQKIDLTAVATHGRRNLASLFLGSVADQLLRCAAVPILLQRSVDVKDIPNQWSGSGTNSLRALS